MTGLGNEYTTRVNLETPVIPGFPSAQVPVPTHLSLRSWAQCGWPMLSATWEADAGGLGTSSLGLYGEFKAKVDNLQTWQHTEGAGDGRG